MQLFYRLPNARNTNNFVFRSYVLEYKNVRYLETDKY